MKYDERLDDRLDKFAEDERGRIAQARDWAGQLHAGKTRASGEPELAHLERVAAILAGMGMDADSVVAGLLHHAMEHAQADRPELERRFGGRVAALAAELASVASLKARNKTIHAADTLRKMLFAMTSDLRVIIVMLADKLDSMRTLRYLPPDDRKSIAADCLDVFAPLADRLGISWLKDELEDLALKEINREAYDQIKLLVAGKKAEREALLERARADLVAEAKAEGMQVEVMARAKHFYSIYQKMRRRAKGSDELYDLSGLRLLCGTETECYALVGIVHRLWKPVDGRFKDYIARPKANGYQSIHTTVLAYEDLPLEIQIRTRTMHDIAEFGVASHWLYKRGSSAEARRPEDLAVVRRLQDWASFLAAGDEFLSGIKAELLKDSIFVFTPKGDPIELPAGATPLDFAYAIHTSVGERTMAAKADGAIIPLDAQLRNTQVVDILTSATARPSVNWLNSVRTSRAKSKIRQWLVNNGLMSAPERAGARKRDERDDADRPRVIERRAEPEQDQRRPDSGDPAAVVDFRPYKPNEATDTATVGLRIAGAGNLMVRFAGCCKPAAGDRIVGYVSRGRGIVIHRAGCPNLPNISEFAERRVDVSWEVTPGLTRRYRVSAKRSDDLFSEIENAAKKNGGRLLEGRLEQEADGLSGSFTMAFSSADDAKVVERNLRNVPSILAIRRED
ncbi:MAG: bifunctional (p)ppGpp synthetase/guanosine-3',5'-bis(diphosphate) 3'-pyrophosphohydrolase [Spirochaetia bacterium]|nr:bifunctional (p)ppGpp synthetase/guanosine-3',5'-bis(diphosphate) 3'-pyrophosphohydrolase [Spirochaetia bacterium]